MKKPKDQALVVLTAMATAGLIGRASAAREYFRTRPRARCTGRAGAWFLGLRRGASPIRSLRCHRRLLGACTTRSLLVHHQPRHVGLTGRCAAAALPGFVGPVKGWGIKGFNDRGVGTVAGAAECVAKCGADADCKSVDYWRWFNICYLSSATIASAGNAYTTWNGFDYYEKIPKGRSAPPGVSIIGRGYGIASRVRLRLWHRLVTVVC